MPVRFPFGVRPAFAFKLAVAAVLVAIGDVLIFESRGFGWNLGGFALAFALAWAGVQPASTRDRRTLTFLGLALLMSLVLIVRPTFAGWFLFGCFIGVTSLSPRAGPTDNAWTLFQRLAWQPICGAFGPLIDLIKLTSPKMKRQRRMPALRLAGMLILPVLGGLLFLGLFAAANPIIADALSNIETGRIDLGRFVFWGVIFVVIWAVLRPRFLKRPLPTPGARGDASLPGVTVASVLLSLVVFNALFAVQNGLDIAFLWSGQRLPEQFTLAEYVKAGVYPLLASAVATGLFFFGALRPGSSITASPLVRILLGVWVAQNLFVVASSAYRMLLYVESYGLTRLRILVLIWMVLVAIGLISILWRTLRDRSTGWLLNVNASALLAGLFLIAVVDLGSLTARWNIAHAREMGGKGVELDVCYLGDLGDAAVAPLAALEARADLPASLKRRVAWMRRREQGDLENRQNGWRTWTPLGAWRIAQAGPVPAWTAADNDTDCRSAAKRAADLAREEARYEAPAPTPRITATPAPDAAPDTDANTAQTPVETGTPAGPATTSNPSPQSEDPSLTRRPQSR